MAQNGGGFSRTARTQGAAAVCTAAQSSASGLPAFEASSGLRDLQLTIDSLEPIEQDLTTLLGAFRYRIADSMRSAGIRLNWMVDEHIPPIPYLDARNCLHVLRIVQEVFTNILKHANADEVTVTVSRGPKYVGVQIQDNGVGFVMERTQHGKGLKNMAQRAATLGGSVETSTQAGLGTRFLLKLPLEN